MFSLVVAKSPFDLWHLIADVGEKRRRNGGKNREEKNTGRNNSELKGDHRSFIYVSTGQ